MKIYLCGIYKGTITGQMQTLLAVKDSLKDDFDITEIKLPRKGFNFFFDSFIYFWQILGIIFSLFLFKRETFFYLVIHRSKLSFWLRDFPIYFINSIFKTKFICHLVGSDIAIFFDKTNKFERLLLKRFFSNISCWVFLGNNMKKQVESIYENLQIKNSSKCYSKGRFNFEIISGFSRNEIPFKEKDVREKIHNFNGEIVVGYLSNFIEEKGISEFIEAVVDLKEKYNLDIKAWFAGATIGYQSERVSKAIAYSKDKDFIENLGPIFGQEKGKRLKATHVFVLPTYYKTEALPLSLIEAMKFGCACISSNIGEIKDLLKDDRGILLEEVSTEKVAEAIIDMTKDINTTKNIMMSAYSFADQEFSYPYYKKRIKNLIDKSTEWF
tara:strand:- start:5910 stop:7058 length:1149 start_codon:yes stop_codon:yes gene_type:complete